MVESSKLLVVCEKNKATSNEPPVLKDIQLITIKVTKTTYTTKYNRGSSPTFYILDFLCISWKCRIRIFFTELKNIPPVNFKTKIAKISQHFENAKKLTSDSDRVAIIYSAIFQG